MHLDHDLYLSPFDALLERNASYIENYRNSHLMQLINSELMTSKANRDNLLDKVQVFSDYFQKVIMLRSVFCEDLRYLIVANEHLREEFGHNLSLAIDRKHRATVWDPVLDAGSSWFCWKILTLDNDERTVLIHLVLEASANIFFHAAHQVMSKFSETNYFEIHSNTDAKHEDMGKELLKNATNDRLERLLLIQKQGWDILNIVCDQIATFRSS